ncbi:glycosyl transferase [Salipaludibacillus keqinensis]|uniref:Glycosyl transferase n=1 Tax=Salipaludibacillus keqinensis TaxID=2045207 RepID=A0A323TI73_9BACI|nr:glycosyltransferase [Salipaludibacillus keqinensis]PYZ92343.1 glycosyl transferase [Salipaludibacillus keqinensis]
MVLFILSIVIFTGALYIASQWYHGVRKITVLDRYSSQASTSSKPFISIIVAAKNEEQAIFRSVQSLLNLNYSNFEVIVVNDRSTDQTLSFLENIKKTHRYRKKLKIITITSLPKGWLGKNHALYQGTKYAKGDYYLFADGDVIFSKTALAKAVHCIQSKQLDHLTVIPENIGGTLPYRAFHSYWSILGVWNFIQLKHAGVGAFNLINTRVYQQIGTHQALSLSPDDDLKLGKKVVEAGFKQQLAFGKNILHIQWYENIRQVITGLEKNLFAFMRYNTLLVITFSFVLFLFHVLPFIGVFSSNLYTRGLFLATLFLYIAMYLVNRRFTKDSPWFVLWMPFNGLLFIYCLCRSAYKTIKNGHIEWRGTHYSLKELRGKKRI